MSVESVADRLTFIADFGVAVSWSVGAGPAVALVALFDGAALPAAVGDGADALNARATLTLPLATAPAGAGEPEDVIVVDGVTYAPKNMRPDGQGMLIVELEEIAS